MAIIAICTGCYAIIVLSSARDLDMTTPKSIEVTQKLIDKFVAKVSSIGEVQTVLLIEGGEVPRIWTVLYSKPFDREVRRHVYDTEDVVLLALDQPLLDFRLINLSEFGKDQRPYLLPERAKVLYKRQ